MELQSKLDALTGKKFLTDLELLEYTRIAEQLRRRTVVTYTECPHCQTKTEGMVQITGARTRSSKS